MSALTLGGVRVWAVDILAEDMKTNASVVDELKDNNSPPCDWTAALLTVPTGMEPAPNPILD